MKTLPARPGEIKQRGFILTKRSLDCLISSPRHLFTSPPPHPSMNCLVAGASHSQHRHVQSTHVPASPRHPGAMVRVFIALLFSLFGSGISRAQDIQFISGNIITSTWYRSIMIIGDTTVAAGNTLTIGELETQGHHPPHRGSGQPNCGLAAPFSDSRCHGADRLTASGP